MQDADDTADLSDHERGKLLPIRHSIVTPHQLTKPKRVNIVCNTALFVCPYLFGVVFILFFVLFYCLVLSRPILTVLNAFPDTNSSLLDFANISKTLNIQGNVSVAITNDYQYGFSSYLYQALPFEESSCYSPKFYVCNDTIRPSSIKSYLMNSKYFPCVAYLNGVDSLPSSELEHLTKISDFPQFYFEDSNEYYFYGLILNSALYPEEFCTLTHHNYELNSTEIIPISGLYSASQSVRISLPHYELDFGACLEVNLPASIHHNSKLLIITNNGTCKLVIYWDPSFSLAPYAICICFIFVFLIACDLIYWAYRRCYKNKYE